MERICDWCREPVDVSNKVESVRHEHIASSVLQKNIKFIGMFESVDGKKAPKLCGSCQHEVFSGMVNGGNYKMVKEND